MNAFNRIYQKLKWRHRRSIYRKLLVNDEEAWNSVTQGKKGCVLQLRSGQSISGDTSDDTSGIFCEIFVDRCYSPDWFLPKYRALNVIDLGANIGVFALYCCIHNPGTRLCLYEPDPSTFEKLKKNMHSNHFHDVSLNRMAVCDMKTTLHFNSNGSVDSGHSAFSSLGDGFSVDAIDLETCVANSDMTTIDLLKIDTEGAEDLIIRHDCYDMQNIDRVVAEFHSLSKRDALQQRLTQRGYKTKTVPIHGHEDHLGLIYAKRTK